MNKNKYVTFDIETTGLSADDRVVSYCLLSENDTTSMCCDCEEIDVLEQLSVDIDSVLSGKILVTFNGENWSGGFDIPFLRTRYVIADMIDMYPFGGVRHIDLMPIFQKKFNTAVVKESALDDLSAAECKDLVNRFGYKTLGTKAQNIGLLNCVDISQQYIIDEVLGEIEPKIVNKYGLKHCYHLLFGGEVGTTGADVKEMWENGEYKQIAEYNKLDCEMTKKLLYTCLSIVPEYDMRYFVL